ncbi:MAG TPA: glycerate kinase [Dongiaceae bacterium]|nr:glycerate kinase [Dongiaceae bacterium]
MSSILIVPDKFKGTLSAGAAAEAIARGWRKGRPEDHLTLLPMSDGGDGFGEVMSGLLHAKLYIISAIDAAHRPCATQWWWEPKTRTAIIESAKIVGLAMLPPKRFHPFALDTAGLGAIIPALAAAGAQRCLAGIGGSATNDGGFGLARALGWEFLDGAGCPLEQWTALDRLARLRPPRRRRWFKELRVAVDVENRLLGPRGATRVYGPQKGLQPEDFCRADRCLGRLARVARRQFGHDFAREPGAGAAGGLGFGLLAFLGARLEPGFELFARQAKLALHLRGADLVITGEGRIDPSTLMGKGVGEIARQCRRLNIPCIALAGLVHPRVSLEAPHAFTQTRALTELTSLEKAKAEPARWLERLAQRAASEMRPS